MQDKTVFWSSSSEQQHPSWNLWAAVYHADICFTCADFAWQTLKCNTSETSLRWKEKQLIDALTTFADLILFLETSAIFNKEQKRMPSALICTWNGKKLQEIISSYLWVSSCCYSEVLQGSGDGVFVWMFAVCLGAKMCIIMLVKYIYFWLLTFMDFIACLLHLKSLNWIRKVVSLYKLVYS